MTKEEIPEDVVRYYHKVLELSGVKLARRRVRFLVPDVPEEFPMALPVSSRIYYDRRCRKEIKHIVAGRYAVIVSGQANLCDIKLAVHLNYPMLNGNPILRQGLMSQDQMKNLFHQCGLPLSPYAANIVKEEEIVSQLTKLILKNIHIDRWIFKINGEHDGKGLAFFDIHSSKAMRVIRSKVDKEDQEKLFEALQLVLLRNLPQKLRISRKDIYPSFLDYVTSFIDKGGIIEASPCIQNSEINTPGICFQISPCGEIKINSTFERLNSGDMTPCGFETPQRSLPELDIETLIFKLSEKLYNVYKLFGFFTLTLLSFKDTYSGYAQGETEGSKESLFWAMSLKTYYTPLHASIEMLNCVQPKEDVSRQTF